MFSQVSQLLSPKEVQRVHEASLEILDQVGLEVGNARARERLRQGGCHVDESNNRVTFPPAVVEDLLQAVPPRFKFFAREPELDRVVPDDAPLVITASSAPRIIDPVTGQERFSTSADIARIARLVDNLPGIDLFSIPVLANDAPTDQYSLARCYTALKHCRKPIRGSGDPGIDCQSILELAHAVAGSEAAYRERPFITHHFCPVISPLKMDNNSTELLMFYAEEGLPGHPSVVPNAGLTSPFTLPATLTQGNAEFLALAVLTQLTRAGTPMLYSSLSTVGDMRTGAYAPGGIECGMLNMAHAQMAAFYKIPSSGYIGLTNAKLADAQAGYEKALSSMAGLLGGMHVLQFAGLIDALMTFDYGMAVIDNEIALMLKRVARGVEFSEADLALEEIGEVGPGGMFLETDRTLELMRRTGFLPEVADRRDRQTWTEKGALDASACALEKARDILAEDRETFLSPEAEERIRVRFNGLIAGDFTLPEGW